jgi:hypothetical protein
VSIVISNFARGRLFAPGAPGTKIVGTTAAEFEAELNRRTPDRVLDGYAPFCKLHVHPNWTETPCQTLRISGENESRLRSGYESRNPAELPVLTRWFEDLPPVRANWLLAILYSAEQMRREGEPVTADWALVGCLATETPEETPMAPITMMRNALGVEFGGSGVPIDADAYRRSVEFWNAHANWRPPAPGESR